MCIRDRFKGDADKIRAVDASIAKEMGFDPKAVIPVSGVNRLHAGKAQLRLAGCSGRDQLLDLFLDGLIVQLVQMCIRDSFHTGRGSPRGRSVRA